MKFLEIIVNQLQTDPLPNSVETQYTRGRSDPNTI